MATVIDELVVKLGFDTAGIEKGEKAASSSIGKIKDSMEKGGAAVEHSADGIRDSLGAVSTKLLELATLFTGGVGMTAFMGYLVKSTAELGRLAKVLDTNAQELWAWEKIGNQVGATSGEIAASWQGLVHTFNDFAIGLPAANAKFIRFFTEQGVQFTDASGKLRSMTDVYMQLAKVVEGVDPARAEAYLRGLGLSPGTINLILQGTQRLAKSLEEMKRNAPTPEEIARMTEAQAQFNKELAKTETLGREITTVLLKPFNALLQLIETLATKTKEFFLDLQKASQLPFFQKLLTYGDTRDRLNAVPGEIERRRAAAGLPPGGSSGGDQGVGGSGTSLLDRFGTWHPGSMGGLQGTMPGGAPGGSSSLTADRMKYARELENNPMLREKLLAISAAENNNPNANLAVMETMMNRASARGTSLAAQLQFAGQGGYYPTANYSALKTAKRSMYEANLTRALGGSNVSNYATDNSSNQPGNNLAARDVSSGRFQETVPAMNGEHFFIPKGQGGGSMRRKYDAWRSGIGSDDSGSPWGNNARAVPWLSNPAAFALLPGGRSTSNTTNNSSTAETHVGSVTVQTQATDAYGIAKDFKGAMDRFNTVGNTNNGPN